MHSNIALEKTETHRGHGHMFFRIEWEIPYLEKISFGMSGCGKNISSQDCRSYLYKVGISAVNKSSNYR